MKTNYIDNLSNRREFFQRNYPMLKIARQRIDVDSSEILKNTCPVCGYLTLSKRDSFEICAICYWEDDGIDNYEINVESGPNHMTLMEGRQIFETSKRKLMTSQDEEDVLLLELKEKFFEIDYLIDSDICDNKKLDDLQNVIISLLTKNEVYGLDKLFEK